MNESRLRKQNAALREMAEETQTRRHSFVLQHEKQFAPFASARYLKLLHKLQQSGHACVKTNGAKKKVSITSQPASVVFGTLRDYQLKGLEFLVSMHDSGAPCILGDEMGLGKTIQSIAFLAFLREHRCMGGPHLVVAPLNVLTNWCEEFQRWCPTLRVVRFHGAAVERKRLIKQQLTAGSYDVVVTTYEMLTSEAYLFQSRTVFQYVIVDEAHRLKNHLCQASLVMRGITSVGKILLTGTPLQNNLTELWALLNYMYPRSFPVSDAFDQGFDLTKNCVDQSVLVNAQELLDVVMLRRLKSQVALNLPPKTETKVMVPLSEYQVFWYKNLLARAAGSVDKSLEQPTTQDWRKLMNLVMQLRKVCNHPHLITHGRDVGEDVEVESLVQGSGKMLFLDKMLPKLKKRGHRVLIFSQFTSVLNILEVFLKSKKYRFMRLDGGTNRVKRNFDIKHFNAPNSPYFVYLVSTRAGGIGINLTSADTVIMFDSDWNPQQDLQAQARVHRIGQTKPVRIFRLVMKDTVEERVVLRAEKKLYLDAVVTKKGFEEAERESRKRKASCLDDTGGDESDNTLSKAELVSMIKFGAERVFQGGQATELSDGDIEAIFDNKQTDSASSPPENQPPPTEAQTSSSSSSSSASFPSSSSSSPTPAPAKIEAVTMTVGDFDVSLSELCVREFQGKTFYKSNKKLADEWEALERSSRSRKSTMITVDGYSVRKENNYTWEAISEAAQRRNKSGRRLHVEYRRFSRNQ